MRRLVLVAALSFSCLAIVEACVGEDPSTSPPASDGGGGSNEAASDTGPGSDTGADGGGAETGPPGTFEWAVGIGGTGTDQVFGLTTDSKGNILVVGSFASATMDVGCAAPLTRNAAGGALDSDGFVVKLGPDGKCLWAKSVTGVGRESIYGVATDPQTDAVYVVGESNSAALTIAGAAVGSDASAAQYDGFLAKLDAAGGFVFGSTFGGSGDDVLTGVAVAPDSSIVVAATFTKVAGETMRFGSVTVASADDARQYATVAGFTSAGNPVWARSVRGDQNAPTTSGTLTVDKLGDIVLVGTVAGALQPATYPSVAASVASATGEGSYDVFLTKVTGTGNHDLSWAKVIGGTQDDQPAYGRGAAVDGSGNVFFLATFSEAIDFGGGALAAPGGYEVGFAKYQTGGGHVASRSFSTAAPDGTGTVAVASDGSYVITGAHGASFDFGLGPTTHAGNADGFIAAFDANDKVKWARAIGGADDDNVTQAAIHGDHVVIAGRFESNIDVGGKILPIAGAADVFVAKMWR